MDDRKRPAKAADNEYAGLNEATAGWDPYLSDLLTDPRKGFRQERRRAPRDRKPARRRSLLLSGRNPEDPADRQED